MAKTRSQKRNQSPVLQRKSDGLTIKEGDFILHSKDSSDVGLLMIKDIINRDPDTFLIQGFELVHRRAINLDSLPTMREDGPHYVTNEIYLTPNLNSIALNTILKKITVLNYKEFKRIDQYNEELAICRHFFNSSASSFTDQIDIDYFLKMFHDNKNEFVSNLNILTKTETIVKLESPGEEDDSDAMTKKRKPSYRLDAPIETSPAKKTRIQRKLQGLSISPSKSANVTDEESENDERDPYNVKDEKDNYIYESESSLDEADDRVIETESEADDGSDFSDIDEIMLSGIKKNEPKPAPKKVVKEKQPGPELPTLLTNLSVKDQHLIGETETETNFMKAKKILGTNAQIQSLPCRENEFQRIFHEVEDAVLTQTGKCLYISGTPGVGKTATVRGVIKQLSNKLQYDNDGNKLFNYLEINGMKLAQPQSSYELLWKKISGKKSSAKNALLHLQEYFELDDNERLPLVVLLDELDQMVSKNQTIMYNFFNWPIIKSSKLIVIAVANTMDLPERLLTNKIASRLGTMSRIQFTSYTFEQLSTIISHRLESLSKSNDKLIITKDAIEFASRKVASVSGDARRSLMICIRAVELAELEFLNKSRKERKELDGKYTVTIMHIMKAVNETSSSPIANYLYSLSFMSKFILACILLRKRRTGNGDINIGELIDEINTQFQVLLFTDIKNMLKDEEMDFIDTMYGNGVDPVTTFRVNGFSFILNEFEDAGILVMQQVKSERNKLLRLNVNDDEVSSCFRNDPLIHELLI